MSCPCKKCEEPEKLDGQNLVQEVITQEVITPPPPTEPPVEPSECVIATVTIDPPDGSYASFPTFVVLSVDTTRTDVVIRYTIDGTEVTSSSPLYTGPFTVTSKHNVIKARAYQAGCPDNAEATATYLSFGEDSYDFRYFCDQADHVGIFNEFAPNGDPADYHFGLTMNLSNTVHIQSVTILQTDSNGHWNSGQSWSTMEFLHPFPDPGIAFHTFPLVLITSPGGVQLNSQYYDDLDSHIGGQTGTVKWHMWGQQRTPDGYFKLTVVFTDGTSLVRIISNVCDGSGFPPPPCLQPDPPTLVADCTVPKVTITATIDANTNYQLWRKSADCENNVWTSLIAGTSNGVGAVSYDDTTVTGCCHYDYYIAVQCNNANYVASSLSSVAVGGPPRVSRVFADPNPSCPGDTILVTVIYATACGTPASVTFDGSPGANPETNTYTQEYVLTAPDYPYTVEIIATNACGSTTTHLVLTKKDNCSQNCFDPTVGIPPGLLPTHVMLNFTNNCFIPPAVYNIPMTLVTGGIDPATGNYFFSSVYYFADFFAHASLQPSACNQGGVNYGWRLTMFSDQNTELLAGTNSKNTPTGNYDITVNFNNCYSNVSVT